MANYNDILDEIKKRRQNANLELNNVKDVLNYAQNNGKSYEQLADDFKNSSAITRDYAANIKRKAANNNIAYSSYGSLAPTLQSIANQNIGKKAWERTDTPSTSNDIVKIVKQNKNELEEQKQKFNDVIGNTEEYKDYAYRVNKLNPTLAYSRDVAKVKKDGVNGFDKAFAPIFSGLDNVLNPLKDSFQQNDNSRVTLPSINDIKTSKAMQESDNSLYKGYASVTQSIGNMIPGIVLSALAPGTGLGTTYFAANTYNEAVNQALLDGYNYEQANNYGIVNSALEVGIGKVLGGTSALLGKSPASKLLGEKITSKLVTNPAISSAISDMVSEFGEEYIQEWLDPKVKAYFLDNKDLAESWEASSFFDKQNFYAGLLGALSAGITNTPNAIKQGININNQFENIVDTLQQDGNQTLTKDQVKQLKQTFYNEYNNAIKNNGDINYNNLANQYENVINNNDVIKEKINDNNYNFTGNASLDFSQQVEQWKKGNINQNEHLVLFKETPKLYQQMGLENHPITLVSNKLDRIYNETGKQNGEYHGLGELVKQLPDALEHPLNIVESATDPNSIVVITELSDKNNNIVIASIKMNGNGQIEIDNISKNIPSNVLTSSYGKDNYDYSKKPYKGNYDGWMKKNADNGKILYDIDEGIKKQRINGQWLQLPNSINSFIANNIPQTNENVNNGISQYNMPNSKKNIPLAKEKDVLRVDANAIANEMNGVYNYSNDSDIKQRRWVETSTESDVLKDKVFIKDLDPNKINYVVESNQKSLDTANKHLDTYGYEKSLADIQSLLRSDKLPKASDIALAERVLQETIKNGDSKTAQELLMDIAIVGTDLGQATQALSIIKKLTPEGQLKLYTKIIQRAKAKGEKSFQDVNITPEMVQNVLDAYNSDGTYDQADLNNRVEQFKQQIADQMKSTKSEKINAWRYLSMLGNPKTHIRNIISNVAMGGTIKVKNAMARTIESIVPLKEKTKTWKKASKEIQDYAKKTANDMKDIITGENKYNEKSSLESKKQIFKSKVLEKISNFNGNALEAEDWFFSKRAFQSTLQEYLTANGINTETDIKNNLEIVEKAKNYAVEQAEIATFRQYSKLASQINSLEKNNKIARLAIEATVPFKKTPINVAKAGVKYSPLGLIKSISYDLYQLKVGNIEASQFIDNLSQGLTGTSLTLLGYSLAKAGILNGAGGDDKDDKYDSSLGDNQYSIKIGDKSYSISWLSPVAMPLLVGANAFEQLEEKERWDMNVVSETLAKTLDPLNEMSFMSGLTNALTSYGSGVDKIKGSMESVAQNYVGQFFPTLFSQFANVLDDKKRSTKASNNSSYKFGEQTLRSIMYKLPGLRNQLEVATDIWGNEKEQSDNVLQRAFESFLAPYSTTKNISSNLDKEIKNIYNLTGETGVIPSVPYAYVKYNDQTYRMSANEYTKYKETYGKNANKYLNNLIISNTYKNASNGDKAKMIKNIYDYAKAEANEEYFKGQNVDYTSDTLKELNQLKKIGIDNKSLPEYVSNKTLISTIKSNDKLSSEDKHKQIADNLFKSKLNDKQLAYLYSKYYSTEDKLNNLVTLNIPIKEFIKLNSQDLESEYNPKTGKTISGSKKKKVIEYINSLNLSIPQKAILIKSQYNTFNNYNNEIVKYVNNLNKTIEDKKVLLKSIGFDNYDRDVINYINSQNMTIKDKETKLKSLGFTVRDGRVYS